MDQTLSTILLVGAAFLLLAWPMFRARFLPPAPRVAPAEVKRRMDQGEDLLLLDVRTAGEFRGMGGHIPGSVNVELGDLYTRIGSVKEHLKGHRDTPVVVVCQSGFRATRAAGLLKKAGLSKVEILAGGLVAWTGQGLPVDRGA